MANPTIILGIILGSVQKEKGTFHCDVDFKAFSSFRCKTLQVKLITVHNPQRQPQKTDETVPFTGLELLEMGKEGLHMARGAGIIDRFGRKMVECFCLQPELNGLKPISYLSLNPFETDLPRLQDREVKSIGM